MAMLGSCCALLFAAALQQAIPLPGVTGERLRARAFFDANNVKVGDPMTLTVDFLGEADFAALHPPALARHVDRAEWKLDDASAKTSTYNDARRITWRLRPLKPGVLWFPPLEFSYADATGGLRLVRSNPIPVHAVPGRELEVAGMSKEGDGVTMPEPPPLVTAAPEGIGEDALFAWQRACANPTADAFAEFDDPAAKLNEARCALLAGDWKRALSVYSRLEWRIGQTPEIERGVLAALARKTDNPLAELPVWRTVGRPFLRFAWKGRLGLAAGAIAAVAFVFWLLGRIVRLLAALSLAVALLVPSAAEAQDPFAQIRQMQRQMEEQMRQMQQNTFSMSFGGPGGGFEQVKADVTGRLETDVRELQVGQSFRLILTLECPKSCTLEDIRLKAVPEFGLKATGQVTNLAGGRASSPSNRVMRLSIPVRYDVPFKGDLTVVVEGMASIRREMNRGRGSFGSFTSSTSFRCASAPLRLEIKPLPTANQPADFSGIIADGISLIETTDLRRVHTNDVVQITYSLRHDGYLPEDWMPEGAAFEIGRNRASDDWRRFFVADGAPATPKIKVVYYAPKEKKYRTLVTGGTRLVYVPDETP